MPSDGRDLEQMRRLSYRERTPPITRLNTLE